MSIGFLDNQSTDVRRCIGWFEQDGHTAGGAGNASHSICDVDGIYDDALSEFADITASATGFNIAGGNSGYIGYLAVSYKGNNQHAAGSISSPTATGSQAITGIGFQPHFVLELQSVQTAYNSATNSNGWAYGLGVLTNDTTDDHSLNGRSYNVANPTVTKGRQTANSAVLLREPSNAYTLTATLTSFDADGYTKNWTVVDGTARKFAYIAVGPAPAAGHPARRRLGLCGIHNEPDPSVRYF
jgi:hypothetical protein